MSSKRDETRAAILDAAWALLEARGAAVGLEDVARAAGVSRQAVYLHFASRNELLVAVTEHAKDRVGLSALARDVDDARTPRAMLEGLAAMMAAFHPRTVGAALAIDVACHADRAFSDAWNQRGSGRVAAARALVGRLAEAGWLAVDSPEEAAELVWGLTSPALYHQLVVRRGWTADRYAAHLGRLLLHALVAPDAFDHPLPPGASP